MAQAQAIRIPLRDEGREAFLRFARELPARRAEVCEALAEEGLDAELVLLDDGPEGPSVVIFTRGEDLVEAHARYLASEHPVQVAMRSLQAHAFDLDRARVLEVLLDLTGDLRR